MKPQVVCSTCPAALLCLAGDYIHTSCQQCGCGVHIDPYCDTVLLVRETCCQTLIGRWVWGPCCSTNPAWQRWKVIDVRPRA